MGELKKRWSVTYTKHIKQKRKVYQDGFLDLQISSNKVMLYDDCEKLLECKILRQGEDVSFGATLEFSAYLVDVGDPEGDHKPITDVNFQGRDANITQKPGSMHGKKIRNNSVSYDGKANAEKNKVQSNNLSPSRKIIREWQVLYTTQVTQRAKKYHDGFLRVVICGSLGRQVMLFDATRKLLDSRFLKKDEVIRSGESIAFDAHLVEIGEFEEKHKPLPDLNVEGNNYRIVVKTEVMQGQQHCLKSNKYDGKEFKKSEVHKYGAPQSSPDMSKSSIMEWLVMYTAQVTQKTKKYHDGFLRLVIYGSQGRQIKLYDASKKLIDSRFLRKDEVIRSGESIQFDAHLVDVGEPEGNHTDLNVQDYNCNVVEKTGILCEQQNSLKANKSVVKEKSQNNSCSRKDAYSSFSNSGIDEIKLSKSVPTNKPLRNANQILSILQKPPAQESAVAGCTDKSMMRPVSSTKELQDTDAVIDFPKDSQLPGVSVLNQSSCENVDTDNSSDNMEMGKSPNLMCSKVISSYSGCQFSKDTEIENSLQPDSDNVKADNNMCGEAFASGISSVRAWASHSLDDNKRKSSEELERGGEPDECPSFDLGF